VSRYLRLAGSVALLGLLAWRINWSQLGVAFARLRCELWLLAVLVYVGAQCVSSVRWRLLARPLGFEGPLRHYVAYYFIGMFFSLVLPTSVGGDVVRAWYLAGEPAGGRRLSALLSVFLERCSGLLVLLAIACAAALFGPVPLPARIHWCLWSLTACGLLGVLALHLTARCPVPGDGLRPVHARLTQFHDQFWDALRFYLRHPRLLVSATLLSIVVQAANVLLVWLIGVACNAGVPAAYYWVLVPLVSLLTLLPFTVNGMGVREWAMVALLAPLHVGTDTAVSLAFLWFAACSTASLGGLVPYLFGRYARPAQPPSQEERPDHGSFGHHSDQGRTGQSSAAA
jgi:uncharacterized protein (TIRG00374 family)